MDKNLIWQQNSDNLNNGDNFKAIADWWSNLNGKEVAWQQRLIPSSGNLNKIDWQPQKFDEKFILQTPQVKGITLYWRSSKTPDERDITPSKLQLNLIQQQLYIIPQSQSQIVISISLPEIVYQKLNINNPQVAATIKDGKGIILLRDEAEKLEITIALDTEKLNLLRDRLNIKH